MWALHYWRFALFVTAAILIVAVMLFYPNWITDLVMKVRRHKPLLNIDLTILTIVPSLIISAPYS